MLAAAIKKEYTTFYFTESKIKNPILSFLIWNFAIESISFSKGKEFSNGFLMTDIAIFDCFLILLAREKSDRKKVKAGKTGAREKLFIITQPAIACSKLTIETLEQGVKYVQS